MRFSSSAPSPKSKSNIVPILFLQVCILAFLGFALLFRPGPFDFLGTRHLIASYSNGEFQDYTDYKKYQCKNVRLADNQFFKPIDETNAKIFLLYIDDFERWVIASGEDSSLYQHYDFDRSIIDSADYFYIDDGTNTPNGSDSENFCSYDVYFFDYQSSILYFFHNNI